jgi:hypothetical protein
MIITVPHSKSGVVPRSSLLGAGQLGLGNLERVGQLGEGWGKQGQFTSNLRRRWTIPVTTGGCQVSGKGYKGKQREQQGEQGNQQGEQGRNAPCIYVTVMYMQRND